MEKIDFRNNQQPALNETNLNKLQDNVEQAIQEVQNDTDTKLNADNVKTAQTLSDTDTYSCNYINEIKKGEIYSTTETKTNKVWIDGKPIYRKVITVSNIGTSFDTTISGIDSLFFNDKSRISWNFSSISYPIDRARFSFTKQTNRIAADNEDVATWSAVLVLEYTKTTD